jgi:hypothetical protein
MNDRASRVGILCPRAGVATNCRSYAAPNPFRRSVFASQFWGAGGSGRLISGGDRSLGPNGRCRSCACEGHSVRWTRQSNAPHLIGHYAGRRFPEARDLGNSLPRILRRRRGLFRTWWGSARPSGALGRPGHGRAPSGVARPAGPSDGRTVLPDPDGKLYRKLGEVAGLELGRWTGPRTTPRARGFPSSLR